MDFSFLEDPQWLKQREAQWALDEENIKEGLTKKTVTMIRHYYFTGEVPKAGFFSPREAVLFFPKIDIDGIAYCLKNNIPSDISEEDLWMLQGSFAVMSFKHLDEIEKKKLFSYTFGETYGPKREFPFPIGASEEKYPVVVGPHYFALEFSKLCLRRCLDSENSLSFWFGNPHFFFSLMDYLDPRVFSLGEVDRFLTIDKARVSWMNEFIRDLMKYSIKLPDAAFEGEHHEVVEKFLNDFKSHLDSAELPPAVTELWQHIKQEHSA